MHRASFRVIRVTTRRRPLISAQCSVSLSGWPLEEESALLLPATVRSSTVRGRHAGAVVRSDRGDPFRFTLFFFVTYAPRV